VNDKATTVGKNKQQHKEKLTKKQQQTKHTAYMEYSEYSP
jgi:hypothetical protein